MSEIFVAQIFFETAPKPYLGVAFRYKVCLILVNDAGGRGLLSYWGRRRREGTPPPQKPSVSLQRCLFILHGPWTWVIGVLKRKVTGLLQFSLAQSFSNLNAHGTQLEDPLKCRYGFSSSGVGGGLCISNKLSSDEAAAAAAPASGQNYSEHLERHPSQVDCPREQWANPSAPSH